MERIFWQELGTKDDYDREVNGAKLGRFIRSITHLTLEAVQKEFSEFLSNTLYTDAQIQLISQIISWLTENGTLYNEDMKDPETFGGLNISEVFGEQQEEWNHIQIIISSFNDNAERKTA